MCAGLAVAVLSCPVAADAQERLGDEFQVNTYTTSGQDRPSVAMDDAGNFVVVWHDGNNAGGGQDGSGYGIFGRRFAGNGSPLSGEFQVNTYTTQFQLAPKVAMDADGDFVVVWRSGGFIFPDTSTQDGSAYGVFGQRFTSAGNQQGVEFQVNTYTTEDQFRQSVAMDDAGDFVVVWRSLGQDGSGNGVFGQRFDSGGSAGPEFRVNTHTTLSQSNPSVAMDGNGNFVVAWVSYTQDGDDDGIFGQRFGSAGGFLDDEFPVNAYTTSTQDSPSVAMDADGDFVVVWASSGQDGSSVGIFGRRFDSSGSSLGGEFPVNTYTTGAQADPSVAVDADGNFVVVWASNGQDGDSTGVFGRRFASNGSPIGGEFQVNTYTTGAQQGPSVAMDSVGTFAVVWASTGQDGDGRGIFGQRFRFGELDFFIGDEEEAEGDPSMPPVEDTGERR